MSKVIHFGIVVSAVAGLALCALQAHAEGKLTKETEISIEGVSIDKALEYLSNKADTTFEIDRQALGDKLDESVTVISNHMSPQTALERVCGLRGIAFCIENGKVLVSTPKEIRRRSMVTKFYDVRPLIYKHKEYPGPDLGGKGLPTEDWTGVGPNAVTSLFRNVPGVQWDDPKGDTRIEYQAGRYIVTQTPEAHERIQAFHEEMIRAFRKRTVSIEAWFAVMMRPFIEKLVNKNGNSSLLLTAKDVSSIRALISKGTDDIKVLGTCRTVCLRSQKVHVLVGRQKTYVSGLEVKVNEQTVKGDPETRKGMQGNTLEVRPIVGPGNKWILVELQASLHPAIALRPLPAHVAASLPEAGVVNLPATDIIHFAATARISDGGAVLLSGSSVGLEDIELENAEVVLILTAKVVE